MAREVTTEEDLDGVEEEMKKIEGGSPELSKVDKGSASNCSTGVNPVISTKGTIPDKN